MIKNLRKLSIGILVVCLMFVFSLISSKVVVEAGIENDTKLSDYAYRVGELETRELMGGVTLYKEKLKTVYNGIDNGDYNQSSGKYCLGHNTVQWVDLPKASEDVKVIVWSEGTENGWKSSTVRNTARHYEETHPGWIVVAAVNGDGFQINSTYEPNNIHVQEGDVIQPRNSVIPIGWQSDNTPIIGGAQLSNTLYVQVLVDGNVTKEIPVSAINKTPSATGITLLTKDMENEVDLTGYTVMVGKYDLCRMTRGAVKPFVRGELISVKNDLASTKPVATKDGENVKEFFLVSKDGSLEQLAVGDYVRCQYPLTGAWANVDNVISGFGDPVEDGAYNSQVLKDGRPLGAGTTNTFANTTHPRTVVGFKEDGSTVLMVANGRAEKNGLMHAQEVYGQGLSYFQEGEVMRLAGCVNAFNLDGGGSSTLVVRNEYGDFDVINTPSDGSERSIGNAILFVMRDPGIRWDVKATTRNDVVIKMEETAFSSLVTDVVVTIDGKSAAMENGVATISGLKENTEYLASVTYKIPSEKDPSVLQNGTYKVMVKTKAFQMPSAGFKFVNVNKDEVTLTRGSGNASSWFENIKVTINGETYNMGSAYELKISNLIAETKYTAEISYDVVEPDTGNRYHGSETKNVTTLSFSLPEIVKFEIYRQTKNRITFSYEYTDEDGVVEYANILCNGEKTALTSKRGTIAISDLDLENEKYTFKIQIAYDPGTQFLEQIFSSEIVAGSEIEVPTIVKYSITFDADGGVLENAPTEYVEGVGLDTLPTPTKEGYKFLGWFKGNEKVEVIGKDAKDDMVLKAQWEEIIQEPVPGPVTPTPAPTPSEPKKGCGCGKSAASMIMLSALLSCALVIFRKRK